jgi:hypothetical protein
VGTLFLLADSVKNVSAASNSNCESRGANRAYRQTGLKASFPDANLLHFESISLMIPSASAVSGKEIPSFLATALTNPEQFSLFFLPGMNSSSQLSLQLLIID